MRTPGTAFADPHRIPSFGHASLRETLYRMHGPRLRRSLLGADRSYRFRP